MGFYASKGLQVFDPATDMYRDTGIQPDAAVQSLLHGENPAGKIAALQANPHPHAQFLRATQRDVFHYSAVLLADLGDNAYELPAWVEQVGGVYQPHGAWSAAEKRYKLCSHTGTY